MLYLPDGSRYRQSRDSLSINGERRNEKIVVTGAFPIQQKDSGHFVETVRDPKNPERLMFLVWENGNANMVPHIEADGKLFVPPDPTSRSFPSLSLPHGLLACGEPAEMLAEFRSTISKFATLREDDLLVAGSIVLASWFPDCLEAAPYLWIVGPMGSGKTKLLKLLRCFCRRGLIAGDLRSGSLYKLTDAWDPTLMIDELEPGSSGPSAELLRLLRTGSVPNVPVFRNGQPFSTYCLKVISSCHPLSDAALLSRGLVISLLPSQDDSAPLDELTMEQIEKEFQGKLLMFRLKNYATVKNFRSPLELLRGWTPRMKQIARALTALPLGDAENISKLLAILEEHDDDAQIERSLEPEWLVAEALFELCHKGMESGRLVSEILVGGLADYINDKLASHGEDLRLSPKKVSWALKGLRLRTKRLGRLGRGFTFTSVLKRKSHEIARQLGIDRRTIAPLTALEHGYGGVPCLLCEEWGLTGGLRFVGINRFPRRRLRSWERRPLFDNDKENQALVREGDGKE